MLRRTHTYLKGVSNVHGTLYVPVNAVNATYKHMYVWILIPTQKKTENAENVLC